MDNQLLKHALGITVRNEQTLSFLYAPALKIKCKKSMKNMHQILNFNLSEMYKKEILLTINF